MARYLPFQRPDTCIDCGKRCHRDAGAWRCWSCDKQVQAVRRAITAAVNQAIKRGELKPPTECLCFDCEAPATAYDHRSYLRPLDVAPVCRSCNQRRGPAAWRRQSRASERAVA